MFDSLVADARARVRAGILVVEDERIVARDLEARLTGLGYGVLGRAAYADEAISKAEALRPNLILMDIRLAGNSSGIEAADVIRKRMEVPVVFLTAFSDTETLERAKNTAPFGYLVKPFKEAELRCMIEIALERHRAEASIVERGRRFETTLRSIGDAVVATDAAGRITLMNQTAQRITGWREEEAIGRRVDDVVRLRDQSTDEPLEHPIRAALSEGRVVHLTRPAVLTARDGAAVPVEDAAAPISADGCSALGGVMVFRDTTEHRRAELGLLSSDARCRALASTLQALQASEAKLAGIISIAADAIIVTDDEMRMVMFNRAAEEIFGWTRDEAIGMPMDRLMPERFRESHRRHVAAFSRAPLHARRMGQRHQAIVALRKDGEEFPVEVAISRMELAGSTLFTAVLRDMTERRRAENDQRFLAEVGAILALTLDFDETLTAIANVAVRRLGDLCFVDVIESEDRVRRLTVAHNECVAEETADALKKVRLDRTQPHLVSLAVHTHEPMLIDEVRDDYLRSIAQNEEHLAILRALCLRSLVAVPLLVRGECLGALVVGSSSESRRYDGHDLRLCEELARRAALAVDNARSYRAAREAIRARDEMLGVVAHDLRNPLSAIRLSASVLAKRRAPAERDGGAIDAILHSSARAERLIADLLQITHLKSGRLMLDRSAWRPIDLLRDGASAVRALAAASAVELRIDAPPDLPEVCVDRDRVLQVIENLLGNAVKFSPRAAPVVARARLADGEVVFEIVDEGPGIPRELLPHVFDRFWQASSADRRGVGLGLTIASAIVAAHGGRIWVESALGEGTTFSFTLPGV